jgi:hypothetical protein
MPSSVSKQRARGADERLHQELRDAAVMPVVGDDDAELAAARARVRHVARVADDAAVVLADERHVAVVVDASVEAHQRLVQHAGEALEAQMLGFQRQPGEELELTPLVVPAHRPDGDGAAVGEAPLAHEVRRILDYAGHAGIVGRRRWRDVDPCQTWP